MLLPWLYFIFIFLIMTLFWLMLCCLVAGLCRTVFRLLLVCSLKWPKMLQILHCRTAVFPQVNAWLFARALLPTILAFSWADTLSCTLLTWLLESPPLNIFRQAFPISQASTKVWSRQEECRHRSLRNYILLQGLSSELQTVELDHPSPDWPSSKLVCSHYCSASPQPAS